MMITEKHSYLICQSLSYCGPTWNKKTMVLLRSCNLHSCKINIQPVNIFEMSKKYGLSYEK